MKEKTAIALGTFDGVHKGHRTVLSLPSDCHKTVVTFNEPPKATFSGEKQLIMTPKDKFRVLKSIGIDEIFVLDFEAVKDMPAQEFLDMLRIKYSPSIISCGYNYRFGKNGNGNVQLLNEYCAKNQIELMCADPVMSEGENVSSTLIRNMLKNGDILKASKLLSEPFSFEAPVITGDRRGRKIGFPTINQRYPNELVKLKFGVYKTKISFENKEYVGITNIGIRPTFVSDYIIAETYIKDFAGDLYGKDIRITPLCFLREEKKFSSLEELSVQIKKDLEKI